MGTPGVAVQITSRDPSEYFALYDAALKGDWETANSLFFQRNSEELKATITFKKETALHVAVQSGKENDFVQNLVDLMPREALALTDIFGYTALHKAAKVGNKNAAITMLAKNPDLLYILCSEGRLAVTIAAQYGQKDILVYLISVSEPNVVNSPFEGKLGIALFVEIISCQFFDVALDLVKKYPDLARLRMDNNNRCALSFLAEMDTEFANIVHPLSSKLSALLWKRTRKEIRHKKEKYKQAKELAKYLCREMKLLPDKDTLVMLQDSIFRAAEHNISEIVEVIMEMFPIVTASVDSTGRTIMHVAASNRSAKVFNLICNMSDRKHLFTIGVDNEGNNLMHMCARLAPPHKLSLVHGPALQMQRELQWFNEMRKFVPPTYRNSVNKDGKTPRMLFTEQHQELKAQGEKWMKDTATACSIAATLIATVVFAAAFAVPGGVSEKTGIPVRSEDFMFSLFVSANAISLFTSLLIFISIITSRYAENDFLDSLPMTLSIGLFSLYLTIMFMLLAFFSALSLTYHKQRVGFVVLVVATFGWWPVAAFLLLQIRLYYNLRVKLQLHYLPQ